MSKCIAEFEMPKDCWSCPCFESKEIDNYCKLENDIIYKNNRPEWCPLKEIETK